MSTTAKKEKKVTAKIARQARLPGTEDAKIEALHSAALDYAEIRDERMELTEREVKLKDRLLGLMKSHKKETYHYGPVTVTVLHEDETVKVRVAKAKDESGDA